jgi:hypothetical protein
MKNLLPIAFCALLFLYSCTSNKAEVTPQIAISAVINGKYETFNFKDTARSANANVIYVCGTNDTTSDKIIFILGSPVSLTTGTYASHSANSNYFQMLFGQGPGFTFDNYYYTYNIIDGQSYDGTVNITTISQTNVQGTFSGTLVLESSVLSNGTRPVKTITNGKFNLSIQPNQQP